MRITEVNSGRINLGESLQDLNLLSAVQRPEKIFDFRECNVASERSERRVADARWKARVDFYFRNLLSNHE